MNKSIESYFHKTSKSCRPTHSSLECSNVYQGELNQVKPAQPNSNFDEFPNYSRRNTPHTNIADDELSQNEQNAQPISKLGKKYEHDQKQQNSVNESAATSSDRTMNYAKSKSSIPSFWDEFLKKHTNPEEKGSRNEHIFQEKLAKNPYSVSARPALPIGKSSSFVLQKPPVQIQKRHQEIIETRLDQTNQTETNILPTAQTMVDSNKCLPQSIESIQPQIKKRALEESHLKHVAQNTPQMPKKLPQPCTTEKYTNLARVEPLPAKNDIPIPQQNISAFRTARDELHLQNIKKYSKSQTQPLFAYGASNKSLGGRRNAQTKFVPPIIQPEHEEETEERLINIEPKMVELITNEIMHKFKPVEWNDIAGLEYAKATIQEAVVWPLLRPDIFTGLRRPPRGILLFGPPGTGKTLIGRCIASQSKSTFFSISASSLTSKWMGDGEKMVRALFAVAAVKQPSVVFIDEIDSLLCQRSESEHESSRRLKTEFLIQLDGAATSDDDRILIVGATNRPQELDEAARRRLVRRLYIPLPELPARIQILKNLLNSVRHELNDEQISDVGRLTDGYSGADMESLCREASMEPIRSIPVNQISVIKENEVRDIHFDDFKVALSRVRASVSQNDLEQYVHWNKVYGSGTVY